MALEPGGPLMWMVIGLLAGLLGGMYRQGGSFGLLGDLVAGVTGSVTAGFLASLVLAGPIVGPVGNTLASFIGAVICIAGFHAVAPRRGLQD